MLANNLLYSSLGGAEHKLKSPLAQAFRSPSPRLHKLERGPVALYSDCSVFFPWPPCNCDCLHEGKSKPTPKVTAARHSGKRRVGGARPPRCQCLSRLCFRHALCRRGQKSRHYCCFANPGRPERARQGSSGGGRTFNTLNLPWQLTPGSL